MLENLGAAWRASQYSYLSGLQHAYATIHFGELNNCHSVRLLSAFCLFYPIKHHFFLISKSVESVRDDDPELQSSGQHD